MNYCMYLYLKNYISLNDLLYVFNEGLMYILLIFIKFNMLFSGYSIIWGK